MTIQKVPCQDGDCIVYVSDNDGEPVAIQCFSNELNAKQAVKLLKAVLTELGVEHKEAKK